MMIIKSKGIGDVITSIPIEDGTELELYDTYVSLIKHPVEDDNRRRYNIHIGNSPMDQSSSELSPNLLTLEKAEKLYSIF